MLSDLEMTTLNLFHAGGVMFGDVYDNNTTDAASQGTQVVTRVVCSGSWSVGDAGSEQHPCGVWVPSGWCKA